MIKIPKMPYYRVPPLAESPWVVPAHMSGSTLKTYINLAEPTGPTPLHALCLHHAFRDLVALQEYPPHWQISPPPGLRKAILVENRLNELIAILPSDVPKALRSQSWQKLVDYFTAAESITDMERLKLYVVLGKLSMYEALISISDTFTDHELRTSFLRTRLALRQEQAKAAMMLSPSERSLDVTKFIALSGAGIDNRIHALITLIVHFSIKCFSRTEVDKWCEALSKQMSDIDPESTFCDRLLASRAHRALAFGPFHAGDTNGVRSHMHVAEEFAMSLDCSNELERTVAAENMHPLLESLMKEALWAGHMDLAEERALRLIGHDPSDPKVHSHLGDLLATTGRGKRAIRHYRDAARLGAPLTHYVQTKLGSLLELEGELEQSLDSFLAAFHADPLGISPLVGIRRVAGKLCRDNMVEWSTERLNILTASR